ncbi:MAG: hypothetical protein KDB80_16035 [Planctomycetes bacterium]|nr:hypothetical protein [Planctomycetota bacterium]
MSIQPVSPFSPLFSGQPIGASLAIRGLRSARAARDASTSGASVRELAGRTLDLRRALDAIRDVAGLRRSGSRPLAAATASANPLSISTSATAASLKSTDEVNALPTSFSPRGPSFAGSSSAEATVGGVYDGSQGDDTLTIRATIGGIVGLTLVRFEVRDGQNQLLDTVDYGLGQAGDVKTLSNGLTIRIGSGSVTANDSFQVDVWTSLGSAVDPTNPFDGTRNQDPNFEPSLSVGAGSFQVNGVGISVVASDSIDSVLAKINASAAGVTATFDTASERVVLTQNTPGSASTVTLGADTSGFLAATKLASATVTAGTDDERTKVIADVPSLSGIASGTYSINGTQFSVNVLTDSLDDVITAINQSGANATAGIGTSSKRFQIASTDANPLTLGDGTSGLFTALGVTTGTFEPRPGKRPTTKFEAPDKLRQRLEDFGKALDDVFRTKYSSEANLAATLVQGTLKSALARGFGATGSATSFGDHGLTLDFERPTRGVFDIDFAALRRAVEQDPREFGELLAGREGEPGLLDRIDEALADSARNLGRFLGSSSGLLLDVRG